MYSYDYSALRRFIDANKLQKKDVLKALGTNDYVTLNKWIEGEVPMHITAMMRLCNYYQYPLDNFFLDDDHMAQLNPSSTEVSGGQPMPTGYSPDAHRRRGIGIVETVVDLDARSAETAEAERCIREGEKRRREHYGNQPEVPVPAAAPAAPAAKSDSEALLNLKLQHAIELRQLETTHNQQVITLLHEKMEQAERIRRDCQAIFDAERTKLMEIIERQSNEIANLTARPRVGPYMANVSDESQEGDPNT